jgi:hypothetical protein
MTELLGWLQRVLGSESRAVIAAVTAALAVSVILAIAIFNGLMALLDRLSATKDKCPNCRRRALAVCWSDESDEDGVEYTYSRCDACGMRYRARGAGPWEDASASEFDMMYGGNGPC